MWKALWRLTLDNRALSIAISTHFKVYGYEWKIGDERRCPEPEEVKILLDKAAESLYAEPDGATLLMTTGRLVIKKEAGHIDVYAYLGEYNDEDS
jgi:hypothetical protein